MAVFKIESLLRLIFWCLLACCSSVSSAATKVEYRVSRTHGLIVYALSLAGSPHRPTVYQDLWKKSRFFNTAGTEAVSDLQKMTPLLQAQMSYGGGADQQPIRSPDLLQLLIIQSIFSQSLEDLNQRSLGLLPMNDHRKLFTALKVLEAGFEDLVWKKGRWELLAHQKKLETLSDQVNLDELFAKAKKFYGSSWPKDLPFTVGLYAVPFQANGKNGTNSSSIGSVEEHGVLIGGGKEDLAGSFGVIFHELCHAIFDVRAEEAIKTFDASYLENSSPYRWQAKSWANEVLATTVGNGWVFEIANKGKTDEGPWYNNPLIDGFARQIFPLTKDYLNSGKTIDRAYIHKMITLFAAKFPEALSTYSDRFNKIAVIHSQFISQSDLMDLLQNRFFISSLNASSTLLGPQSAETLKPSSTALIVLTPEEVLSLTSLAESSGTLKKYLTPILSMKPRSYFSAVDEDGKAIVVLFAKTKDDVTMALDQMKKETKIDPKQPIHSY